MDVTRTTVPGNGPGRDIVHHLVTRAGQRFGLLVESGGRRRFLVYDSADADEPVQTIVLDQDEADQIADLLHSRSLPDRLADLERRVARLTGATP
ncbi:hypothetical protein AB0C27_01920 [Nonomuraea sp. NPDC048882]|uniref:hypothetical protein n=1 Tax=unclassified Nonomuraea TaxID=2593643 RepID=UPI0033FAD2A2